MILCVAANPAVDVLYRVGRLTPGAIHRPDLVLRTPGGKPLNVARAARAIGAEVGVVALLGGRRGRWIAGELHRLGVACHQARCAGETRQCVSVLDEQQERFTEFYEPGPAVETSEWQELVTLVARRSPRGGWVAISGSLPPGAPSDGLSVLVEQARGRGAEVAVDTAGPALRDALRAEPDLVKVNEKEARAGLAAASGQPAGQLAAALGECARVAVVTHGAGGAVLCDEAGACWAARSPATGAFSVGCGDALLAGMLGARTEGADWVESLRAGVAVAAANALRTGPGCLDLPALARLRADVVVTRL